MLGLNTDSFTARAMNNGLCPIPQARCQVATVFRNSAIGFRHLVVSASVLISVSCATPRVENVGPLPVVPDEPVVEPATLKIRSHNLSVDGKTTHLGQAIRLEPGLRQISYQGITRLTESTEPSQGRETRAMACLVLLPLCPVIMSLTEPYLATQRHIESQIASLLVIGKLNLSK